jgi:hypothetical protein
MRPRSGSTGQQNDTNCVESVATDPPSGSLSRAVIRRGGGGLRVPLLDAVCRKPSSQEFCQPDTLSSAVLPRKATRQSWRDLKRRNRGTSRGIRPFDAPTGRCSEITVDEARTFQSLSTQSSSGPAASRHNASPLRFSIQLVSRSEVEPLGQTRLACGPLCPRTSKASVPP